MGNPQQYFFDLQGKTRPPRSILPEVLVNDIDWFNKNRATARVFDSVLGVTGVVIHATAGSTSGGALQHWRTAANASSHWIVPGEQEPQHGKSLIVPVYEARAAHHVRNDKSHPLINGGKSKINHWTLGVEIVNRQNIGNYTDPYSAWQVAVTAQIVRYCWAKYPNFRWVFSHAAVDPGRRADPGPQFPWQQFEQLVIGGQTVAPPASMALVQPRPEQGEMEDRERAPCCA